jgi:hypothetical protein
LGVVDVVWTMAVDEGPPTQLTHFDERAIVDPSLVTTGFGGGSPR